MNIVKNDLSNDEESVNKHVEYAQRIKKYRNGINRNKRRKKKKFLRLIIKALLAFIIVLLVQHFFGDLISAKFNLIPRESHSNFANEFVSKGLEGIKNVFTNLFQRLKGFFKSK